MYDHTHIASYRDWGARSVGKQVQLLALDSRNVELAGGLSSNPILSGLQPVSMTPVKNVCANAAFRAEQLFGT